MDATNCSFSLLIIVSLISVCLCLFKFYKWHYWKKRGVPYLNPVFPVVGNMYDLLFLRSLPDVANRIYKQTELFPYVGIYAFHTPVLFVRDVDIIERILIKDFKHFEDRGFHFNEDDTLGRNLIHQRGPDWKFSRSKLSPCFNATKVKSMLEIMESKSEDLVELIEREMTYKGSVEVWELSVRYTTDVVVLCTMGVGANSLIHQQDQFHDVGKEILGLHFIYHVFVGCFLPKLHKWLRISVAKGKVTKFFHSVLNQIIDSDISEQDDKQNLLHTLLQTKEDANLNNSAKHIPEIDQDFVVAQAFIFFLTGHETPANILASALFEIAKQPQIQETMLMEIKEVIQKHKKVTFDALKEMKYLQQVISETLRRYAPLTLLFRRCTKEYTVPGTSTTIEEGTLILIPINNIHNDSRYYHDPANFQPERFSDEGSAARHIAKYMPFGIGPRMCPVVLYSHMIIKMALVKILLMFEVCLTEKTPAHLQASAVNFLLTPKNGIPLTFRRR